MGPSRAAGPPGATLPVPSPPVHVRPAGPDDRDVLVDFNAALAAETEDKQLDRERLSVGVAALLADPAKGRYLVAEEDGRVLGALAITTEWSDWRDGWFWWIQSVYVHAEARGRGVYRLLHEEVLRQARVREDVCGVRLYVEEDNTAARRTYERRGMHETSYRLYETDFREETTA